MLSELRMLNAQLKENTTENTADDINKELAGRRLQVKHRIMIACCADREMRPAACAACRVGGVGTLKAPTH
jgi:hypothetical protein